MVSIMLDTKDWPIKKETTFEFGHFTTPFGQFFANYKYIFHKTEGLIVSKSQLDRKTTT